MLENIPMNQWIESEQLVIDDIVNGSFSWVKSEKHTAKVNRKYKKPYETPNIHVSIKSE